MKVRDDLLLLLVVEGGTQKDEIGHTPVHRHARGVGRGDEDKLCAALLGDKAAQTLGLLGVRFDGQDKSHEILGIGCGSRNGFAGNTAGDRIAQLTEAQEDTGRHPGAPGTAGLPADHKNRA